MLWRIAAACLVFSVPAAAQTASVRGTVLLPTGAPAPHASVTIDNLPGSAVTADDSGRFVLTGVATGRVTLVATLPDYNPGRVVVSTGGAGVSGIRIRLGAPLQLASLTVVGRPTGATYVADTASSGTKIAAPLMQVPLSVQVVPQTVLKDQQALRLDDALVNVAGVLPVTYGQLDYDSYSVRGFDLGGVSYDDGMKQDEAQIAGLARDLSNIQQVEVVKGPASVLYGQAEPGGLVNVVTKQPLATPLYTINQEVGSDATYRTTFDATGPLDESKTILYRINLDYENSGSFRDFIYTHRFAVFPTLTIKPSERSALTLETSYATGNAVGDNGLPFLASTLAPADVPLTRNYADASANLNRTSEYWLKLTGTYQLDGNLDLRVAARSEYVSNPTPTSEYYVNDVGADGFLQRVSSTNSSFWHWVHQATVDLTDRFTVLGVGNTLLAGVDIYYIHGSYNYNFSGVLTPDSINIYDPVYPASLPPTDPADTGTTHQHQTDGGVYVQDLLALPGNLHVLAGARLDRSTTSNSGYGGLGATVSDHPPITPRLGVLWQARPELSLYATFTSNYGATALGAFTKDSTLLPAQTAQQYEVGFKVQVLRRLSATTSVYQLTKQHIPTTDPTAPSFQIAIGEARSRGVEEDIAWVIAPGWQIIGGYSYIDARITKDQSGLQGLRLAGVPYHSGSLWTTYSVATGALTGLRLGGGVVARDGEDDLASEHIPGFAVANAMLGYDTRVVGRTVRLQINVSNVFNATYFLGLNPDAATPGAPRSVIGSVAVNF